MSVGRPQLDTVYIDSVCVDSYRTTVGDSSFKITKVIGSDIKQATIQLVRAASTVLTMDLTLNGKSVTIQRGVSSATEKYIFRGEVVNCQIDGGIYTITAIDRLFEATKVKVTYSFDKDIDSEAGVYSEIAKTLINDYTNLVADATSIQSSGTARIAKKFICRSVSVYDRLKKIKETLGWQLYYDPDSNKVYLEPTGYTNQSTTLQSGVNIIKTPKWNQDATALYNKVEVRGAVQEVGTIETGQIGVTSGYTTTSITLVEKPNIINAVYCDSSNPPTTLRKGGVSSSTATYDYGVDTNEKLVKWNTGDYTPGGSDYVIVDYTYLIATPAVVQDDTSIETYASSWDVDGNPLPKEIVLHRPEITNVDDSEEYATQYLNDHKDPLVSSTIQVIDVSDLEVGQKVYVDDANSNVVGYFFIESITLRGPYRYDEVKVVSTLAEEKYYKWNTEQRIKRLEEEMEGDTELLLHVKSFEHNINHARRETNIYKRDYNSGNLVCIAGHPVLGIPLTHYYGTDSDAFTAESIIQRTPGNNIYEEYVYDTDYYDSVNSISVTWNTTLKRISIPTLGGLLYTTQFALGCAYAYFKVELGDVGTSTFNVYISGDNKNTWQLVTLNSKTPFAVSDGTGVYLKIDATISGTIQNVYTSTGKYYAPAIRVTLSET